MTKFIPITLTLMGVLLVSGCTSQYQRIQDCENMISFVHDAKENEVKSLEYHYDELYKKHLKMIDRSEFLEEIDNCCELIITNGEEPRWDGYGSTDIIIPIDTLNITTDQIDSWEGESWNYWLSCSKLCVD